MHRITPTKGLTPGEALEREARSKLVGHVALSAQNVCRGVDVDCSGPRMSARRAGASANITNMKASVECQELLLELLEYCTAKGLLERRVHVVESVDMDDWSIGSDVDPMREWSVHVVRHGPHGAMLGLLIPDSVEDVAVLRSGVVEGHGHKRLPEPSLQSICSRM